MRRKLEVSVKSRSCEHVSIFEDGGILMSFTGTDKITRYLTDREGLSLGMHCWTCQKEILDQDSV